MTRAVLSIGSNIGDRLAQLQSVVDAVGRGLVAVSPVYRTPPWGPVPQGDFLNAIVIAEGGDSSDWLALARRLESAAHRERREHWGPRTLDVDVISCRDGSSEVIADRPELTLPHPRAHLRAFVLVPWLAVDSDATLVLDGVPRKVAELIDALDPAERAGVRRIDDTLVEPAL
jgi:2-amino-4-hydroxy-6-hydroxymethyldihydropteridine diphosphokinase